MGIEASVRAFNDIRNAGKVRAPAEPTNTMSDVIVDDATLHRHIGDIMVLKAQDVVLMTPPKWGTWLHGSLYEERVPIIGYGGE